MLSLSPLARRCAARSASAAAAPFFAALPSAAPSFCLPLLLIARHGSTSTSQSGRASSARARSTGGSYRALKGRPAGLNSFHVKEPLPQVNVFSAVRLPANIRRKQRAAEAQRNGRGGGDSLTLDVELSATSASGLQPVRGRDGKKPRTTRVKTKVHKALKHAALLEAAQQEGMEWPEEDQAASERAADAFLARAAAEREAFSNSLDEGEREELMKLYDAETPAAAAASAPAAEGEVWDSRSVERPRKASRKSEAEFGVQTVLSFLKESDLAVRVAKRGARSFADASVPSNPLDQDVLVYDVASRFPFADFLVVVKTASARQMRSVAEAVYRLARNMGACGQNKKTLTLEGRGREDWMLLDAGHVWLYVLNKNPAVGLPPSQGLFGVTWNVTPPNVQVGFGGGVRPSGQAAATKQPQQPTLPFAHDSVTILSSTNPFDPQSASPAARRAAAALQPPPSEFAEEALHETSSVIHSSMWFEPTPDKPRAARKREANQADVARAMGQSLDESFHQGSATERSATAAGSTFIDAEFTAVSTPLASASASAAPAFSASSDPSLDLLRASAFTHPVLENLEKTYGDLRVPAEKVSRVKDYLHEDLRGGVSLLDSAATGGRKGKKAKESIEVQSGTTTVVASSATA